MRNEFLQDKSLPDSPLPVASVEVTGAASSKRMPETSEAPIVPVTKKASVEMLSPLDVAIEEKKIVGGPITIQVSMCTAPKSVRRQIRKIDVNFVKVLKNRMLEDASAPGAPAIAVLCSDVENIHKFRPHLKDHYHYEVLGGLHTVTAKQELSEEVTDQMHYKETLATVYCGLTDEECLRLASRHNFNSHLNHKMTYGDYVDACRTLLVHDDANDKQPGSKPCIITCCKFGVEESLSFLHPSSNI